MAAGVGSRISNRISGPKCTLEINTPLGRMPLIRYTVQKLIKRGFMVTLIVGYLCEYVEKSLDGLEVEFCYNPFYKVTNSMASLWFARDSMNSSEDTVLMNADVFWTDAVLDSLMNTEHDLTMLGDVSRVELGDYFFGTEDDKIVRYGKQLTREERNTEYVGMALIKKNKISLFKDHLNQMIFEEKYDLWWENVLYEYCDSEPVYVIDVKGNFWAEVDYFEDYLRIIEFTDHQ